MNLDEEIKRAQERLHRRIGQWGRRDDEILRRQVAAAQTHMNLCFILAQREIFEMLNPIDLHWGL